MVISCDITDFQNNQITASTGILYEHKVLELALQTHQGRKGDMKPKAGSVTHNYKKGQSIICPVTVTALTITKR